MMLNYIVIGLLLLLILLAHKKGMAQSILIYTISTFVAPVLRLGSVDMGFDLIAFPLIFLLYFCEPGNFSKFRKDFLKEPFLAYIVCYLFIILINAVRFHSGISVATLYAVLRFSFILYMIKDTWREQYISFVDQVMRVVLPINLVACIAQMTNLIPVGFFYNLYYKSSMTPLAVYLKDGAFGRACGTFASPVFLAAVSSFCYAFYLCVYVQERDPVKFTGVKMVMSALCGIMALSKTAILSIPIITIMTFGACLVLYGKRSGPSLLKIIKISAVALTFIILEAIWLDGRGFYIRYYLDYLSKPAEALVTRYSSSDGNLIGSMDIIKAHPILGVGHTAIDGVFVGDSTYIVLLYETGMIGLISYFLPYARSLVKALREKQLLPCVILAVFVMIGVGSASHLSYYFVPFALIALNGQSASEEKENAEAVVQRERPCNE